MSDLKYTVQKDKPNSYQTKGENGKKKNKTLDSAKLNKQKICPY